MPENAIGLAKTADVGIPAAAPEHGSLPDQAYLYEGVPIDIYNYFDADLRALGHRETKQIKEIYGFLKSNSKSQDEVMNKLIMLDHKVGAPTGKENRWSKVWSFLKTLGVTNAVRNN